MNLNSTKITFNVIDLDTELADTIPYFEKYASAALDREIRVTYARTIEKKDFQSLAHFAGLTEEEWKETKECLANIPRLWLDLPLKHPPQILNQEGIDGSAGAPKLPRNPLFLAHRFPVNNRQWGTHHDQTLEWLQKMYPQVSLVLKLVEL